MAKTQSEENGVAPAGAAGVLLAVLGLLVLLSLISYDPADVSFLQVPARAAPANFIGPAGAYLAFVLLLTLGVTAYLTPVILLAQSAFLLFYRRGARWPKFCWLLLGLVSCLLLAQLHGAAWAGVSARLNLPAPGGLAGYWLGTRALIAWLGPMGAGLLAGGGLLAALLLLTELEPSAVAGAVAGAWRWTSDRATEWLAARREQNSVRDTQNELRERSNRRLKQWSEAQAEAKPSGPRVRPAVLPPDRTPPTPAAAPDGPATADAAADTEASDAPRKPRAPRRAATAANSAADELASNAVYTLPPMRLLEKLPPAKDRAIAEDVEGTARILESTLADFDIEAKVTNIERGPVVTNYELLPAPGVRVERFVSLSNTIALSLKAKSVRVQAPIPGKGVVGIEVPNHQSTKVFLREILESEEWRTGTAALPLALGQDVGGRVLVSDLAAMPHMLIAGATGAGKTVCMNSLLAGLLMSRTPAELRLMLIDPKIVEFSFYNHLPHLIVPVITDPKKVSFGLRWAINEMEHRYKLFAKVGVRNIQSYNQRPIVEQTELFEPPPDSAPDPKRPPDRLPYIVIVVDELADLMMVAQADIENAIARLAQLSRAVGIHMILATQRPSVNVITGTIKANFPARLAFQVAQKVDSRTILDANGADKLLGRGDMLFLPPGTSRLVRAQGTMTTDQEIRDIVDYWKEQGEPEYVLTIKEKMESTAVELPDQDEDNELIAQAVEIIRQTRRASTSSLQRRLRIGYTRAARLMDILEERGVVGPPCGADPREILIDLEGEIPENPAGAEEPEREE